MSKKCEKCGSIMVKQYADYMLCSYPPQKPWSWYCGCGHTGKGGIDVLSMVPSINDIWKSANNNPTTEKE